MLQLIFSLFLIFYKKYSVVQEIKLTLIYKGVFHFFAINLIFSIWIDHPTYEINPLYFYILTPMCR